MSKDLFFQLREKEQLEQTDKDRNNLYFNITNQTNEQTIRISKENPSDKEGCKKSSL